MAGLDQLKLTAASPLKGASAIDRFRQRMTDAINLQIDIAKADAAGEAFSPLRQKWVKNAATGDKELRNVPIPIRRWWWTDDNGITFVTLKYGAKPIELAPSKNAIKIGTLSELADKLALVREAVRAGELDAQAKRPPNGRSVPKPSKAISPPSKGSGAKAA